MAGKCSRAISLLVQYMNKTSELPEALAGWESRILFELDGEAPFAVIFSKDGKATFENGRVRDPDVTLYCDSDLFYGIMTGRVNQDDAFSLGLVEIRGSIVDSVKFRHASELTEKRHAMLFGALRAVSKLT